MYSEHEIHITNGTLSISNGGLNDDEIPQALQFIREFCRTHAVMSVSEGHDYGSIIIGSTRHDYTPGGISIPTMIKICGGSLENFSPRLVALMAQETQQRQQAEELPRLPYDKERPLREEQERPRTINLLQSTFKEIQLLNARIPNGLFKQEKKIVELMLESLENCEKKIDATTNIEMCTLLTAVSLQVIRLKSNFESHEGFPSYVASFFGCCKRDTCIKLADECARLDIFHFRSYTLLASYQHVDANAKALVEAWQAGRQIFSNSVPIPH